MRRRGNDSAFGQADPSDARKRYDWKSRYDEAANREIRREAYYLGALLFTCPIIMVVLWLGYPRVALGISSVEYAPIAKYGLAWCAGTLGGVLFALKWLYHVVARGWWHLDRRLWRWFTPHISGGLAFCMLALIASGGVRIFNQNATRSMSLVVGFSFLVGYFSDSAIAKLTEVAETLFGTVRAKEKHDPEAEPSKTVDTEDQTQQAAGNEPANSDVKDKEHSDD